MVLFEFRESSLVRSHFVSSNLDSHLIAQERNNCSDMSLLYPKRCLICHDKVMYPFIFCCAGQCIRFIGNAHLPVDSFDSRCQNCNTALEPTRQMCAGCKVARYCNRSCQKKALGYTQGSLSFYATGRQRLTFIANISFGRRWCNRR